MSNSVDPYETAHYEPSHLDLRCLEKPTIRPIAYDSERVKCYSPFLWPFISASCAKNIWFSLTNLPLDLQTKEK